MKRIGEGKGFRSKALRVYDISYHEDSISEKNQLENDKKVTSLVYKYSQLDRDDPDLVVEWNYLESEREFYEKMGRLVAGPKIPLCYWAYTNKENLYGKFLEISCKYNL